MTTNNQNMSAHQEQRRENDIDAAATLLGFRTTLAAGQQVQESPMITAAPATIPTTATAPSLLEQSHQQPLEQYQQHQQQAELQQQHDSEAGARLPPKKRRSKTLGRALPLSQRPNPAILQAAVPPAAVAVPAPAQAPTPASQRPKISRFPQRLMEMLTDETIIDSICWLPHGRSFLIHNPAKFTDEVLPRYFGACKFASFTRKLYRWGFRQISKGPDQDSFFHKNFRRDEPELCDEMICKEEIRDGCPELHGGINAYSLMRMEQADRLQELMKKNLDTKKKLDMARAIKLREQYPQAPAPAQAPAPVAVTQQQQQPEMASAGGAGAGAVDLTASPSPHLPGAAAAAQPTTATGLSRLPEGGGIGLVQRQLLRIEQRRSELQAVLRGEIAKRNAVADSKRRYTQLLARQEQLEQLEMQQTQQYYQEPPRPDRAGTVAESKRRYAELLMARRDRLAAGLTPAVQAQMQASPAMAPVPTPTAGTHAAHAMHHPQLHHHAVHEQDKKAAEDVAITGTFYPSLTKHHQQQPQSTEPLKSCLKKSSPYSSVTATPPFPGYSLLAKHHQHHADLLARYPSHHGHHQAALHHPSPHSAQTLAILRASLEQQRKEELLGGALVGGGEATPSANANGAVSPSEKNVVAAGVINRALETLRRQGFA